MFSLIDETLSTHIPLPPSLRHEFASTRQVCWNKALTFRHTALQAGVECIATEESETLRLPRETRIVLVEIAQRLEAGDATDRVTRAGFDVVDVVVMHESERGRAIVVVGGESQELWDECSVKR